MRAVPVALMYLTRFHGVFSPNSKLREYVVPQKPVEEQESPKPQGLLDDVGSATQTCVCH